ncbi:MAG TPA: GGDEF domain-containing protein [Caldimonas sp.]|nr:GGDEF domain-containing protein [Caldimonas sp.]
MLPILSDHVIEQGETGFLDRFAAISRPRAAVAVVALLMIVGAVDAVTGEEVRVLALYFLPLLLAGWSLGATGAALASVLATLVWVSVLVVTGTRFHAPYVWVMNALTEGLGFLMVSILVARLRRALDLEATLSRTDQLTGLFNRRAMVELVTREIAVAKRQSRGASIFAIDLNEFKSANDRFGHPRGDELLRECARLMRDCLRTSDTIARVGGDEFVVFLPETSAQQASLLADRLRVAVDETPLFKSAGVTLSLGIYTEAPVTSDIETMLRASDTVMYEAKRSRRRGLEGTPVSRRVAET